MVHGCGCSAMHDSGWANSLPIMHLRDNNQKYSLARLGGSEIKQVAENNKDYRIPC